MHVVKLNKPPARNTTERYDLTKKNSLTNQLKVIAFERHKVGTSGKKKCTDFRENTLKRSKIHVWSENKQNIRLRYVTFAIKQIIK